VRLRQGDFQILTQVGQGGYGQVFLAQKKDTREVCALKVMSKKLLFKLDEIRHVLTERDILTNAKSEWLVRLLYSFQDDKSIYLAMVRIAIPLEESRLMCFLLLGVRTWWRLPNLTQQYWCPCKPPCPFLYCRNVLLCRCFAPTWLHSPRS
jgi:serine/threonine protein kinase